jgi:hypothetical protein
LLVRRPQRGYTGRLRGLHLRCHQPINIWVAFWSAGSAANSIASCASAYASTPLVSKLFYLCCPNEVTVLMLSLLSSFTTCRCSNVSLSPAGCLITRNISMNSPTFFSSPEPRIESWLPGLTSLRSQVRRKHPRKIGRSLMPICLTNGSSRCYVSREWLTHWHKRPSRYSFHFGGEMNALGVDSLLLVVHVLSTEIFRPQPI